MPRRRPVKRTPKIELQEVVAETGRRNYEMLRLTRVKYANNPYMFFDLRLFQRGFDADSERELYHPTRKGVQLKEETFQRLIGRWTLVPSLLFHYIIVKKAYPAFQREEFDTAVFRAFKTIEVRIRQLGNLPDDLVGIPLIRKAFDPAEGPLTDFESPKAERDARAHLFAGALGCYKNPHSHRDIELSFNQSFEMLLVASHLHRILDCVGTKTLT
ncbi:MAG: TIGR02391 family protein [Candidatus Aminicenantes bacterium]|nr:TIGR02391 family protein [Candidatus Aminicenantes bacterium]